jgi:Dolichyl-phosphate-mannose-protein mannosyltransferase
MLTLLPVLAFCFVFLRCRKSRIEWRNGLLVAAAIDGACLVLGTELLSAMNLVTRGGVTVFWLVVCAVTFAIWRYGADRGPIAPPCAETSDEPLDVETKYLLSGAATLAVLIGVTALLAPPNVWDAMEYHLPRVVMWMSDRNVRFFPTPDYAQLVFGTWAEDAILHLDLLWGSDRLVNLVEFFSFLGTITGVSLIAKLLGANRRGQALAALVCATVPEAVLEASGPMNTLVVSFWIVATVAFLLLSNEEPGWLNTVCVGISAGLAILTKGTAYVYLPLMVLACWFIGSPTARMRFLKRCPIFLLLIFALNGPQYARAYGLTGSPIGMPFPAGGPRLHWMVGHVDLRETLANVIRGLSVHTVAPSGMLNAHIERGMRTLIGWIGEDPDDPGAVWPGMKFELHHFSVHEIYAGNPLHLLLFAAAICLVVWKRRQIPAPHATLWYAAGIVASFVFFCALLRWQIWESRHHAPLFLLAAAVIGIALAYCVRPRISAAVIGVLLAYALCFAVVNRTRALVPWITHPPWSGVADIYQSRDVQYFSDQHEQTAAANIAAAAYVNQLPCRDVAIDSYMPIPDSRLYHSPNSFYVYPVLAMIHADGHNRRVWYEGVQNLSVKYASTQPRPAACAVICFDCALAAAKWDAYRGVGGRAAVFDDIVVFSGSGPLANDGVPKANP